jgi:transcriptional regulator with XRE-family HTH domain
MAVTVRIWSGREVRAIREAKRMSIRSFAARLGVSERMVSKWEKAADSIHPRPVNQNALDSLLAASSVEVQTRFKLLIDAPVSEGDPQEGPSEALQDFALHQARHPIDGKLMTLVDAGTYLSGDVGEPRWLPAFYIDVFPTTNTDYERFIAATGYAAPQHWTQPLCAPEPINDHPVTHVTWHDASAYAAWSAKFLPTAQQWEKAARGTRGDVYPWGSQLTPAKCNVRESGMGKTSPVSKYHSGVSPYGVYDLCGNTWEWCSTESEPGRRELKGSAFTSPFHRCTPSAFNDASEDMLDDDTGFRCVTPAETMRALLNLNR